MDHAQVLNKVLKADIQNIRSTLDELDIDAFESAIEKILQARSIYVMGLRASAPIAEFFVHLSLIHICMEPRGMFVKHYRGVEMPHIIFSAYRP